MPCAGRASTAARGMQQPTCGCRTASYTLSASGVAPRSPAHSRRSVGSVGSVGSAGMFVSPCTIMYAGCYGCTARRLLLGNQSGSVPMARPSSSASWNACAVPWPRPAKARALRAAQHWGRWAASCTADHHQLCTFWETCGSPGVARCAASPSRVTRPRPHTCRLGGAAVQQWRCSASQGAGGGHTNDGQFGRQISCCHPPTLQSSGRR